MATFVFLAAAARAEFVAADFFGAAVLLRFRRFFITAIGANLCRFVFRRGAEQTLRRRDI